MLVPKSIPLYPAITASRQLDYSGGRVVRWALTEATGTAGATVRLFDGSGDSGVLRNTITLLANESTEDEYKLFQFRYENGLYLQVVSGSVEGCFDVIPWAVWPHHYEPIVVVSPEVLVAQVGG